MVKVVIVVLVVELLMLEIVIALGRSSQRREERYRQDCKRLDRAGR